MRKSRLLAETFELFKSSQTLDGPHHRRQHGFRA